MTGVLQVDPFARGDDVELAERAIAIFRSLSTRGPLAACDGVLWRYDTSTGLFVKISDADQSRVMQSFAGAAVMSGEGKVKPLKLRAGNISGAIRLAHDRLVDDAFFESGRRGLAFADCFVEVTTTGIVQREHSPDHRARVGYAFAFPGHACSVPWLRFLDSLFRDDDDKHEKIALLQEHAGACLVGLATKFQIALILVGLGANGKSAYTDLLARAMPVGSVSAIAPQEWGQEYRRALLAGKLLNVVSELPESDLLASEAFKAIVVGDAIVAREIRERAFVMRPVAGHVFAANSLPGTRDQSEGFWRRFAVVRFSRSFQSDPERDTSIVERVAATELPHVVAWSLEGAVRLLRQGAYTMPPSHVREIAAWRAAADPVASFIDEAFPSRSGWTPASVVYDSFRRWAAANGHRDMTSTKFGLRMRALGLGSEALHIGKAYPVSATGCATGSTGTGRGDSRGGASVYA